MNGVVTRPAIARLPPFDRTPPPAPHRPRPPPPPPAVALLLTLAAAQPVIASGVSKKGRSDADVYFVFDVSRSMAARTSPSAPTRLERARRDGEDLRGMLPSIAIGI